MFIRSYTYEFVPLYKKPRDKIKADSNLSCQTPIMVRNEISAVFRELHLNFCWDISPFKMLAPLKKRFMKYTAGIRQ